MAWHSSRYYEKLRQLSDIHRDPSRYDFCAGRKTPERPNKSTTKLGQLCHVRRALGDEEGSSTVGDGNSSIPDPDQLDLGTAYKRHLAR